MKRAPLVVVVCLQLFIGTALAAEPRHTGPWNMAELKQRPQAKFGEADGLVREVYYENVPFRGKPTRVFGYYAVPKTGTAPYPAMLCVHGGGGKAFREWAELWAERGYVALAMDLAGKGPDGLPHADAGPDQTDEGKFGPFTLDTVGDMWSYHAVAAVVRGHSLLASLPEVDRDRIGVTGISWGGYLTCIVAGIDDRLKCAVPVYGCGFLGDNSAWVERFGKMPPEQSKLWLEQFDPSKYLGGATCPLLFVNGTNDFAYPLDSYQKSYRLPKGPVTLCIRVGMKHGHPAGWAPAEIGIFVDSVLKGGDPLPKIKDIKIEEYVAGKKMVTAVYEPAMLNPRCEIHYAIAEGPWQKREWKSISAGSSTILAGVAASYVLEAAPVERPVVFYCTITDKQGSVVSTPHVILEK